MWRHKNRTCWSNSFPGAILLILKKRSVAAPKFNREIWWVWIRGSWPSFRCFKSCTVLANWDCYTTWRTAQYNSTFTSEKLCTRLQQAWPQFSWLLQKGSALVKSLRDSLRPSCGCWDMPFLVVTICLCFKTRPRAKPFKWKWVWSQWKWTHRGEPICKWMISHEDEWFRTKICFGIEGKGNSEMAYWNIWSRINWNQIILHHLYSVSPQAKISDCTTGIPV